jgi:hypothetical protein
MDIDGHTCGLPATCYTQHCILLQHIPLAPASQPSAPGPSQPSLHPTHIVICAQTSHDQVPQGAAAAAAAAAAAGIRRYWQRAATISTLCCCRCCWWRFPLLPSATRYAAWLWRRLGPSTTCHHIRCCWCGDGQLCQLLLVGVCHRLEHMEGGQEGVPATARRA